MYLESIFLYEAIVWYKKANGCPGRKNEEDSRSLQTRSRGKQYSEYKLEIF